MVNGAVDTQSTFHNVRVPNKYFSPSCLYTLVVRMQEEKRRAIVLRWALKRYGQKM